MVNNMRDLFIEANGSEEGSLSWEQFQERLNSVQMQEYFKSLDVDPSEAHGIFRLLDLDNSGGLEMEEFVSGCIRLRGEAKALDLAVLIYEMRRLANHFTAHARFVESGRHFARIEKYLHGVSIQSGISQTQAEEAGGSTPGSRQKSKEDVKKHSLKRNITNSSVSTAASAGRNHDDHGQRKSAHFASEPQGPQPTLAAHTRGERRQSSLTHKRSMTTTVSCINDSDSDFDTSEDDDIEDSNVSFSHPHRHTIHSHEHHRRRST
jgi:hypothetical protein